MDLIPLYYVWTRPVLMWLLYQMVFHAIPLPLCHFSIHFHKVTGISTPVLFFISLNKCSSSPFFHFSFILTWTSSALFTSLFSFPSPSHPQNFHLVSSVLTSCLQKASLVSSYITFILKPHWENLYHLGFYIAYLVAFALSLFWNSGQEDLFHPLHILVRVQ